MIWRHKSRTIINQWFFSSDSWSTPSNYLVVRNSALKTQFRKFTSSDNPCQNNLKKNFILLLFYLINHTQYIAGNFPSRLFPRPLPPWTMLVRKYDFQTWRKAIRLLGCALMHCVIAHETNIVWGEGERRGKICDFFQEFWQRLSEGTIF